MRRSWPCLVWHCRAHEGVDRVSRLVKVLLGAAVAVVALVVAAGVLVQQYDAWARADLDRNVQEFVPGDTLESCMDEVDGVWLPWLVAEARDMCAEATAGD